MKKQFLELFDFDEIFEYIIQPSIDSALNLSEPQYISSIDFKKVDKEEYSSLLRKFFNEKAKWLESIYWGDQLQTSIELDAHKIASVLCRAIIGIKPFKFDVKKAIEYIEKNKKLNNNLKDTNWLVDNYLVNYKVAVDAALGLTLFDLLNKIDDENNVENNYKFSAKNLKDEIVSKSFLNYYSPSILKQNHADFYHSLIVNVAINDINNRSFDYLAFATICFQLQQFNALEFSYRELKKNKN